MRDVGTFVVDRCETAVACCDCMVRVGEDVNVPIMIIIVMMGKQRLRKARLKGPVVATELAAASCLRCLGRGRRRCGRLGAVRCEALEADRA